MSGGSSETRKSGEPVLAALRFSFDEPVTLQAPPFWVTVMVPLYRNLTSIPAGKAP